MRLHSTELCSIKLHSAELRSIKSHSGIKMDTIFMNPENSKTSEPRVLIPKLTDKLDLRRGEKIIALSILSIYYTWKNTK